MSHNYLKNYYFMLYLELKCIYIKLYISCLLNVTKKENCLY